MEKGKGRYTDDFTSYQHFLLDTTNKYTNSGVTNCQHKVIQLYDIIHHI